ncbi:hypothetical protein BsWGS_00635 [Bradybaena similaris]
MMRASLDRAKNACLFTLVKCGLLILLCASWIAKNPVRATESAAQRAISHNLSTNRSRTASTTKSSYRRTTSASRKNNSCTLPTDRYPHLLLPLEDIETLASYRDEVFQMGTITRQVHFPQTNGSILRLNSINTRLIPFITESSCCITSLSFAIMNTVVSVYTGTTYKVRHYDSSYQAITIGECKLPGAACSTSGTCQITHRIQWVLVDLGNGTDSFVPVNIPSHCYCRYQ